LAAKSEWLEVVGMQGVRRSSRLEGVDRIFETDLSAETRTDGVSGSRFARAHISFEG
jgi:hypothetical protein